MHTHTFDLNQSCPALVFPWILLSPLHKSNHPPIHPATKQSFHSSRYQPFIHKFIHTGISPIHQSIQKITIPSLYPSSHSPTSVSPQVSHLSPLHISSLPTPHTFTSPSSAEPSAHPSIIYPSTYPATKAYLPLCLPIDTSVYSIVHSPVHQPIKQVVQ